MLELIDQSQEFRCGLTKDCQRPMLYDMAEIVMRRGMSKLSEGEAWREQDESVFVTEQVEALDGNLYRPWRSVRVRREERKGVEGDLTEEGTRKGIEELESEGSIGRRRGSEMRLERPSSLAWEQEKEQVKAGLRGAWRCWRGSGLPWRTRILL